MPNIQVPRFKPIVKLPDPIKEFIWEPPVAPPIWPRRMFHIASGATIPLAGLYLPDSLMVWGLITLTILGVLTEAARQISPQVNDLVLRFLPFFKSSERQLVTGATFMLLSATFVFVLFDKEVAILAMLFLAVGDPFAALVGARVHRRRIFGKSLVGTGAFLVTAGAAGVLASLHPAVTLAWWFIPGLVAAAVVELLPLPLDDNVTVPLAGATTMHLLAMV